jgi:uncharacterized membrane protein
MLGKLFVAIGLVLVVIGLALQFAPGLLGWFGRLPGDIDISRDGTRVFIPVTSMIVISLVLTLIFNLFFRR